MKLKCGKYETLDLERMQIQSRLVKGRRIFEAKKGSAGQAAALTTKVVARTFGKSFESEAARAEQAGVEDKQVEVATFRDESGKYRVVYREAIVRFEATASQASRKALLAKYKLRIRKLNPFVADQVIVYDPRRKYIAEGMIGLANELTETDEVKFAFPNFVSEFKRAAVPTPRSEQWHIDTVKGRDAWKRTLGEGIVIAVLDDGVDVDHANLKGNILKNPDPNEPRDVCGRDFFVDQDDDPVGERFDPRPKIFRSPFTDTETNDVHGTPCAGVVAGSGKTGKVFGIAPKARILPVKIFHGDAPVTESHVANAVRYACRFADILSCSWDGPTGPDMQSALEGAANGRGGRGCPIFAASGNENTKVGYPARSRQAIAVGASTDKERRASYSNYGRSLSVVAPSNGGEKDIFTTDVSFPRRGYNLTAGEEGSFCDDFGGTSSATPLAAGVAALVLSVNPNLSREEVKDVLERTADKIGPKNAYNANGHGKTYGFGRVNAAKAVALALKLAPAAPAKKAAKKAAGKAAKSLPKGRRKTARKRRARRRSQG